MKKIDKTVIRETVYVIVSTAVLSLVLHAVFLIIGKWDVTVLFGNLLGAATAVLNFFLMGLTVQSCIGKEEKKIKNTVRLSMLGRGVLVFGLLALGALLGSVFNIIALVISVIFPRIALFLRPKFKISGEDEESAEIDSTADIQDEDNGGDAE